MRSAEARRAAVDALLRAALEAVEPARCTTAALERLAGEGVELDGAVVFAFGKAARGMAEAALARGGVRGGILIAPAGGDGPLPPLRVRRGGHPVPASDAAEVGREVLALARSLGRGDLALCLVSGGGSAMLELPREGLTLEDIARETRRLLASGADIRAINAARAAMSQLKAGGLAAAIAPARIVNVIISDVPGGDPAVVASGPTVPAAQSGVEARTLIAADNAAARAAVLAAGKRIGLHLVDEGEILAGEAHEMGAALARLGRERIGAGADGLVAGGETTVTLGPRAGTGGRNHEVALGAWAEIARGARITVSAFGTDGIDGSSDAAGAVVDETIVERARVLGLDPAAALIGHQSAPFFHALEAQLRPGPTGTNVADLAIVLG